MQLFGIARSGAKASGGSGTVTSVSVTSANGVSGTVSTATTTPAITLSLGAITPTSITANGILTVSTAGAASASAIQFTGTPFVGTGTTSTPLLYLNGGAAPTTWNATATGGTYLGINSIASFVGNFMEFRVNGGGGVFTVTSTGATTAQVVRGTGSGGTSAAVMSTTAAPFASGTGTTNFPQWFCNVSTATAATNWSTTGTVFGANVHTSVGNFLDLKVDGISQYTVTGLGAVSQAGKTATYNNVATAGWGNPAVYGQGRSTAQSAAVASVAAYTVGAADGTFEVSANVNVTVSTLHSINIQVTYTDETNTSQTLTLPVTTLAGAFVAAITNTQGVGPYETPVFEIRCKASTSITIKTTGTFTTVTYNVQGTIKQTA